MSPRSHDPAIMEDWPAIGDFENHLELFASRWPSSAGSGRSTRPPRVVCRCHRLPSRPRLHPTHGRHLDRSEDPKHSAVAWVERPRLSRVIPGSISSVQPHLTPSDRFAEWKIPASCIRPTILSVVGRPSPRRSYLCVSDNRYVQMNIYAVELQLGGGWRRLYSSVELLRCTRAAASMA